MGRPADIRVGTAGLSIPRAAAFRFDSAGTHLQRYSQWLRCAEINSSFYRPHTAATYAKWRDSTPPDFRFAVKMPRTITHELKLQGARELLVTFLAQTDGLAAKRGPILVQLPPSLSFDASVGRDFWTLCGRFTKGPWSASRGMRRGFRRQWHRCWIGAESHEWRRIRHRCRKQPFLRVRRASHIFGCTDHHESTGQDMARTISRRLRRPSAAFRTPRKCGVCSTTPQAAPPSRTPGSCVNA
jgi:uncharacterized protein YecE (DUF72 family)